MSRLKLNIIANLVGQSWSALMMLAFVPLYIKFLGIEAYGLIGFFAMLQSALQVLDLGLSQTMNRELARYSALPEKSGEARDFVRTLEIGYWGIGIIIGVTIFASSPIIAGYWIKSGSIPIEGIRMAVAIMGVVAALQWPLSFYQGGLMGLQHQVLLNGIKICMTSLSGGGAVLILWLVSPTIVAFLGWQIIVSIINVTLITVFLWRCLPASDHAPCFDRRLLDNIWRFAAGMSGISFSAIILMQLDKVILSKILNLGMFGYYTLAGMVSGSLSVVLIGPIFNALFPRFSALVAADDQIALKQLYHQSSQLMTALIIPVAAVLSLFSFDILLLWTGNAETARIASPIVSVMVIGTALNGLMTLPYALQLSHGWTSIGLRINTFFIITLVPGIIFMATHYGMVGAASVWVALNTVYLLIGVPLTHRRLLKGETIQWFFEDVGLPLVAALLVAGIGRWLVVGPMSGIMAFAGLTSVLLAAVIASVLAAPQIRSLLLIHIESKMSL